MKLKPKAETETNMEFITNEKIKSAYQVHVYCTGKEGDKKWIHDGKKNILSIVSMSSGNKYYLMNLMNKKGGVGSHIYDYNEAYNNLNTFCLEWKKWETMCVEDQREFKEECEIRGWKLHNESSKGTSRTLYVFQK